MSDQMTIPLADETRTVVVQIPRARIWPWMLGLVLILGAFLLAVLLAGGTVVALAEGVDLDNGVIEVQESGPDAGPAIAVIEISGTIGPPFTDDWIDQIEQAQDDDDVKAVLLHVDSPGGFVADSHQIYHRLKELSAAKPVSVQFGRLAASGGYYVAMGAGPEAVIAAEPTTWTGSIGVIVPYYNAKDLAEKVGVTANPLKTGKYKDTLSPFRELTADEEAVWDAILADAFDRFKDVIEYGRPNLERAEIDDAATGQIFTAEQAIERGLVDEIAFRDDTIDALAKRAGLSDFRVIRYELPVSVWSELLGTASVEPASEVASLLKAARPEAFYLYGWPATLLPR